MTKPDRPGKVPSPGMDMWAQWRKDGTHAFQRWVKAHQDEIPTNEYFLVAEKFFVAGYIRANYKAWLDNYIESEVIAFSEQLAQLGDDDGRDDFD